MPDDRAARETIELSSRRFAGLLERHVPGLVAGLHLVGSVALGDFRLGRSDLDFVGVLAHRATGPELEALAIVHRLYAADPTFPPLDGIWVTAEDLAIGPDAVPDGPATQDSQFVEARRGNRNPVTWAELRRAVSVVGTVDATRLWSDTVRLRTWTRANVEDYWALWLKRASRLWTPYGLPMLGRRMPMWGVLGISRLHYTLNTGEIASKTGAGEYALGRVEPRWRPVLEDALATRNGKQGPYANPLHRRRDALAYVEMLIATIRAENRTP